MWCKTLKLILGAIIFFLVKAQTMFLCGGVLLSMKLRSIGCFVDMQIFTYTKISNRNNNIAQRGAVSIFGKLPCCIMGNWSICLSTLSTCLIPAESLTHLLTKRVDLQMALTYFGHLTHLTVTSTGICSFVFCCHMYSEQLYRLLVCQNTCSSLSEYNVCCCCFCYPLFA